MNNETKQTAVEWLLNQISKYCDDSSMPFNVIQQAKEMEKEQKQFMFNCGRQYQVTGEGTFKQVYEETYGGNNE